MEMLYNGNLRIPTAFGGVLISRVRKTVPALLVVGALAAVAGCGGSSDSSSGTGAASSGGSGPTLSLVAYSTPEVVYDEIIPDFQKTAAGRGVDFKTSFGASGDQSRAVEAGLRADVVTFSTEPDMTRLVRDGQVAADWNQGPNKRPRHDLDRRVRRAQGQPEAHQDVGRPAEDRASRCSRRTRSPPAPRSGTCSPPTARPRTPAEIRRPASRT